jgi:hypothetical protein
MANKKTASNYNDVSDYSQDDNQTGRNVVDNISDYANQAGRKMRSFMDTAGNEFSHASERVTTEIRNNPVRSSLIALGLGYVLAALIRR